MKIFLACQVKAYDYTDKEGNWTNEPHWHGARRAYVLPIDDHSSVNVQLEIMGLEVAHLCKSKKHAEELCAAWNETFRKNGEW